jgi:phosphomevalonate kinase
VTRWVATAPGKVVLLGEYAVLDGAPALVQAVDRRCRVELVTCAAPECRAETPQLDIPAVRFELDDHGRVRWREVPAPFARTAALIDSVLEHIAFLGGRVRPFRIRIDTSELFHSDAKRSVKLGLGSSAATAVAIDAVLRAAFIESASGESEMETIARLLRPGREAQGNAGSGVDIAASLCGGLLSYRIENAQIQARPMELPEGVRTAFLWAGEPASTGELLAAWRGALEDRPREHGRLLGEMRAVANTGLAAVEANDAATLLACWSDYGDIMGKMNELIGRDVVTVEHRIAGGLAELLGGVYKPCGAGGGDIGMAASDDANFGTRMRHLCRKAGLASLSIGPDAKGVRVTRE